MKWQCSYYNSKGIRCEKEATLRIHFSKDHPFDHMDLCEEHKQYHPGYVWSQDLEREIIMKVNI